jgi:excisionase family DNA binding protein
MTLDQLYTKKHVAKWLGVSVQTVAKMCSNGQLPHFRIGPGKQKRIMFRRQEILDWLELQRGSGIGWK